MKSPYIGLDHILRAHIVLCGASAPTTVCIGLPFRTTKRPGQLRTPTINQVVKIMCRSKKILLSSKVSKVRKSAISAKESELPAS